MIDEQTTTIDVRGRTIRVDFRQKPPFFAVDPGQADEKSLPALLSHPDLTERDIDLVTAIHDQCGIAGGAVGIKSLCDHLGEPARGGRSISANGLTKRINRLESLGLLSSISIKPPVKRRGRPPKLYVLGLDKLPQPVTSKDNYPALPTSQLTLFDESAMLAELWNDKRLRIDDFWCGLIASALPITDKTRLKVLETSVHYKSYDLPLLVSTREGSRIPTIRSIKTVIALLSLVEQIIKEQLHRLPESQIKTQFLIDLRHVLKLLGLPNKGGNRRTIIQYLREWEDAVFRFQDLHPMAKEALKQQFGETMFGFSHHQLISQLSGVGVVRDHQKIPTMVAFELPEDLVRRIADAGTYNLFNVTPAIMAEENPLAIAIHLYCRKVIGHNQNVMDIKLPTLWQRIGRTLTYKDFRAAFYRLIAQKQAELEQDPAYRAALEDARSIDPDEKPLYQEALVLGYRIIINDKDHLAIAIDLEDPYVGLKSRHATLKALAKQERVGLNVQLDQRRRRKKRDA